MIVSALTPESGTELALAWLAAHGAAGIAISGWVGTEVSSAFKMKLRMKYLDPQSYGAAVRAFDTLRALQCDVVTVPEPCFSDAARIVQSTDHGVRAGDALHIAIARYHGLSLATMDRQMHATALQANVASTLIV